MIDFDTIEREEKPQAQRMAMYLASKRELGTDTRIVDVGCGPGLYVDALTAAGFEAIGIDSDARIPKRSNFHRLDVVTTPVIPGVPAADVVISFEVAEHIDERDAPHFFRFVAFGTMARIVYFSAARPGQGGDGHVNCQPKAYWCELWYQHGYYFDPDESEAWLSFMAAGPHMGWLTQNGMVFRKAARR